MARYSDAANRANSKIDSSIIYKPKQPARPPLKSAPAGPKPAAAAAPAPAMDYGTDYGYGGYADFSTPAPAPVISDEDYLAGSSSYQATLAALEAALKNYEADVEAQKKKYETDYDQSLRTMGRIRGVGKEGEAGFKPGSWNLEDQTTASGKAYQSQLGDFASRGMLQSSLYARANEDLMRQLNNQLNAVDTARTNFMDDLERQRTTYKTEDTQKRQQARMEALANRALAGFGG